MRFVAVLALVTASLVAGCGGDEAGTSAEETQGSQLEPEALASCIRASTSATSVTAAGDRVAVVWDSPREEVDIVVAADVNAAQLLLDDPEANFPGRNRLQRFDNVVLAFASGHNQRPDHPALAKCLNIPKLDYEG